MLDQSAKLYVAFRLASRADMCEAQSRHGKAKKVNDLHSFRDACRGCCMLVPPSYRVADVGNLVGLSRDPALGLLCFTIHL